MFNARCSIFNEPLLMKIEHGTWIMEHLQKFLKCPIQQIVMQ